jgi:large subunit ribosomal protein L9
MEVILLERVEKLGQMGQVVRVKDGYARNYLLPKKKALRATAANRERFEKERVALEKVNASRRSDAEKNSSNLDGKTCVLLRQASESGQLYGSVTARDVAEAASTVGVGVTRTQVSLDRPIKNLGTHTVRVFLHPEVPATVKVIVARSEAEAEIEKKRGEGIDVTGMEAGAPEGAAAAAQFFEEGAGPRTEAPEGAAAGEGEAPEDATPEGAAPRRKKRKAKDAPPEE